MKTAIFASIMRCSTGTSQEAMSRYKQRHENSHASRQPLAPPRILADDGTSRDLANALTKHVKVTCSLTPDGITWGKYGQYDAAVMHLLFKAVEPPGYKLKYFKLDLKFAPVPGVTPADTVVCLLQEDQPVPLTGVAPQYIEGRPWTEARSSGGSIEPEIQAGGGGGRLGSLFRTKEKSILYRWMFRSHALPDKESNIMTNAGWIWESNPINPQIEDRGYLYGGVAFRHCSQPLMLKCKVKGTLCQGPIWLRFKTLRAEPGIWTKTPSPSIHDIANHVKELESAMLARNKVAVSRKSSLIVLSSEC